MIHLRIVVPSYQAEHTLDLLTHSPSVVNLIYLERAAKRPKGNVILCDVAREDASVIISDLRELDIDHEGSIAVHDEARGIAGLPVGESRRGKSATGATPN